MAPLAPAVIDNVSIDVSVGVKVPASIVAIRVSVPPLPFNTSAEPRD